MTAPNRSSSAAGARDGAERPRKSSTSTQRHAALRQRLREQGYKRRTVWLDEVSESRLQVIRETELLTVDQAVEYALRKACGP